MHNFENLKLENQLCFALYASTNAITRAYKNRLSPLGLTYPQYLVMMVLWSKDNIMVSEIAQQLQLDSATITPLLKRLEVAGFVNRNRSSVDERVVHVCLTDLGRNIQGTVAEIQKGIACQTGLPESQFIELRSMLHKLIENIHLNQPSIEESA